MGVQLRFNLRFWLRLTLAVFALLLVVFGSFYAYLLWIMAPTRGTRIPAPASPRTALLVVDIQEDYTGPAAVKRFRDGDRIVAAANALLARARERDMAVVLVENVVENAWMRGLMGGVNAPGAPGTAMDHRLLRVEGAATFSKGRSDAFSNPALDAFLRANHVNRILLVGLDGAYCVNATARGALHRGYQVDMVMEGIATESGTSLESLARSWSVLGAQVTPAPALP